MKKAPIPLTVRLIRMFAPGRGRHSIVGFYDREYSRAEEVTRQLAAEKERSARQRKELAEERTVSQTLRGQLRNAVAANKQNSERTGVAALADIAALTPAAPAENDSERTLTNVELKYAQGSFVVQPLGSLNLLGGIPHQ